MGVFRYVVPVLAAASRAMAQNSDNCGSDSTSTMTIQNGGDAGAIATCTTYSGSIAIATGTTDPIAINGVKEITGDLYALNVTLLNSISADSLQVVGGEMHLEEVTALNSLSFPQLSQLNSLYLKAIPNLGALSFTTGVQSVQSLTIDNTFLNSLEGLSLQTADTIYIANNNYLQNVSLELDYISGATTIFANGNKLDIQLPNLEWAYNITIRNATTINMPMLEMVNTSLGVYGSSIDDITTPNLTMVGGSLSIVGNNNLSNLSMPQLITIAGGFQVQSNDELNVVSMPVLKNIGGGLLFTGPFKNISMPALENAQGAFSISSTEDIQDSCDTLQPLSQNNGAIHGNFNCSGTSDGSTSSNSSSGSKTGSGNKSSSSTGAAGSILIPGMTTGVLGVVAALFGLL